MSSKPSKEGVAEMCDTLARMSKLADEISQIESQLPRLKQAKEEYAALYQLVPEQLDKMDVARNGNFGWEGRVVWFLTELRKHSACSMDGFHNVKETP